VGNAKPPWGKRWVAGRSGPTPLTHPWHAQTADPTLADSILDRLVHNAHRLELQGESMRKKRSRKSGSGEQACTDNAFAHEAVEMTDRGKLKTGFHRPLENARAFPTFPPPDDCQSSPLNQGDVLIEGDSENRFFLTDADQLGDNRFTSVASLRS
jgi:hypothetical protein